ncbi:hypothetical protein MANES_01G093766v8 [Manihot esculenta]|uniref:Uncharacterized protein n=2 Tax=Manihot esculenta TaxID=3983 RepID=A0A2C9WJ55_MANES|nr:hypothetical protein MANES_01G094000v8 [Manihot esculenta]OAY60201.1 hypothetical protein MANES_01G093766v8 [Manihot esculenta]
MASSSPAQRVGPHPVNKSISRITKSLPFGSGRLILQDKEYRRALSASFFQPKHFCGHGG